MKQEPNLIIFRVPDEVDPEVNKEYHTSFRLVELNYLADKLDETGYIFLPAVGSSYGELSFAQVVLARKTAGGSLELARFTITDQADNHKVIHSLKFNQIKELVVDLIALYNAPEHHH